MEKRTRHHLDLWRYRADPVFKHHLVIQNPFRVMAEKGHSFINLHSTFPHDAKASSFL